VLNAVQPTAVAKSPAVPTTRPSSANGRPAARTIGS